MISQIPHTPNRFKAGPATRNTCSAVLGHVERRNYANIQKKMQCKMHCNMHCNMHLNWPYLTCWRPPFSGRCYVNKVLTFWIKLFTNLPEMLNFVIGRTIQLVLSFFVFRFVLYHAVLRFVLSRIVFSFVLCHIECRFVVSYCFQICYVTSSVQIFSLSHIVLIFVLCHIECKFLLSYCVQICSLSYWVQICCLRFVSDLFFVI